MLAFVFPGQGSQKRGMGQGLFDTVRQFAEHEPEIDSLLGYSVRELCLEDPNGRLRDTRYTQPSLFVVNALHYYDALIQGEPPAMVAGHSLGEYNALLAAGAFDLLTGLRLVQRRAEIMSQATGGGMAAVVGLDGDRIMTLLRKRGFERIDVANYNSPLQTIISGPIGDINDARGVFEAAGAAHYLPLPVSGAFHSRYMESSARSFAEFLAPYRFADLRLPVVANTTGTPYPLQGSSEPIKDLLIRQISQPVQWTRSTQYMLGRGVTAFKEIGPGTVLTRLIQQVQGPNAPPARQSIR